MKVLHVSYSDQGGAAKSCIRLHLGLLKIGVNSRLLLLHRSDDSIPKSYQFYPGYVKRKSPPFKERVKGKIYRLTKEIGVPIMKPNPVPSHEEQLEGRGTGYELFSNPNTEWDITQDENYEWADVVNFHWVAGFLDYESFFRQNRKPLVWTLHDMNPFTGGCHYSLGCSGYRDNCQSCPQLENASNATYSSELFLAKKESLSEALREPIILSPSQWLKNQSERSFIFRNFRHYVVRYGIDTDIFKMRDKLYSREVLSIPFDKKVILFVAASVFNRRKGFDIALNAMKKLNRGDVLFFTVGKVEANIEDEAHQNLGVISDERLMSMVYSAADLFLIPSLEDNLPNTAIEALCCGCPVIGNDVGGISEILRSSEFCISISSISDMASAINIGIDKDYPREKIAIQAKQIWSLEVQAQEYHNLYNSIYSLDNKKGN